MSDRITKSRLSNREGALNSMLRGVHVETQGRYDYTALDLYDRAGLVRTLTSGTKREVYDYMGAMIEALSIVGREVVES